MVRNVTSLLTHTFGVVWEHNPPVVIAVDPYGNPPVVIAVDPYGNPLGSYCYTLSGILPHYGLLNYPGHFVGNVTNILSILPTRIHLAEVVVGSA